MRCRIPIIYLVDSAGVNLPYQGGVFPGPVRREPAVLLQLHHAVDTYAFRSSPRSWARASPAARICPRSPISSSW